MDPRIDIFCEDWFFDKNILDVGCNAGHFTISIATTFRPKKIVGIDLDHYLIAAARTNVRFLCDQNSKFTGKFPTSFGLNYGPVSAPSTSTANSPTSRII
uniref:RNA methyltransferase n=1 Tax=Ditylenchus dipsaci TaxID=166011 RepID=A0A915E2K7_9BILA